MAGSSQLNDGPRRETCLVQDQAADARRHVNLGYATDSLSLSLSKRPGVVKGQP